MTNPDRSQYDAYCLKIVDMMRRLGQAEQDIRNVRNDLAEKLADYLEAKTKGKVS